MDELVKQCRDCIDCLCGDCKYEHLQKPGNFVPCMNALLGETANAIEELSRENESLAKSVNEASEILRKRWIPVTERLPEEATDVLVARRFIGTKDVPPSVYVEIASRIDDYWSAVSDEYKICRSKHTDPFAWMPLPEPPKEET